MNHWDLTPGELVTLVCVHDGRRLDAVFTSRDTVLARFEPHDGRLPPQYFELLDGGDLSSRRSEGRRVIWRIRGTRAGTRSDLDSAAYNARAKRAPGGD